MNENQEFKSTPILQKWAADELVPFVTACPHIFKSDTKIEDFIEDLNKAAFKINKCNNSGGDVVEAMKNLLPFISVYPQFFKLEIGIESFADELIKAALKYNEYFKKKKMEKD